MCPYLNTEVEDGERSTPFLGPFTHGKSPVTHFGVGWVGRWPVLTGMERGKYPALFGV